MDEKTSVMPYKRPMTKKGFFKKSEYVYDEYYDCYLCPNNEILNIVRQTGRDIRHIKAIWKNARTAPI